MVTEYVKAVPPKAEDMSEWYTAVCLRAELADYSPVRGMMVVRPYGWALWEGIQRWLDDRLKATGHVNAAFPVLVPESLLQLEAQHVQGFSPEVAWVTQGGDEPLMERLAIRPTSEAIMMPMYAKWIQSYRDLPVLIVQWNSVVRWAKSTRLFLRSTEFWWHEGHTAHRTREEAVGECRQILALYQELLETVLALPALAGRKPPSERFPGADDTYTLEALMPDSQALQAGTTHFLGQNFGRAFEVKFLDTDNQEKYVWTTSWAVSTRLIGALIMAHGDDRGLVLPPAIAPFQAVIVPIPVKGSGAEGARVTEAARALAERLGERFRIRLDDRDHYTPGWKFNEWEMRGVPVRLELGPRDLAKGSVVLVRRTGGEKESVPQEGLADRLRQVLDEVQAELHRRGRRFLEEHITSAAGVEEIAAAIEGRRGFVRVGWCESQECEDQIRRRTGASPRLIPLDDRPEGACVVCGRPSRATVYYARAY